MTPATCKTAKGELSSYRNCRIARRESVVFVVPKPRNLKQSINEANSLISTRRLCISKKVQHVCSSQHCSNMFYLSIVRVRWRWRWRWCGGGTVVTPTNQPPTLNAIGDAELFESLTDVVAVTATDPDGDSLTFSLSGEDANALQLSSDGLLSFIDTPDYEAPIDVDADNIYVVTVSVSDGEASDQETIAITILNALEGRVVDGPVEGRKLISMIRVVRLEVDRQPMITGDG